MAQSSPRGERGLSRKKKLLFAAVTLLVAIVGAELAARVVVTKYRGPLFYRVDRTLGYAPRPGMNVTRRNHGYDWQCSTDAWGRRTVTNPSPDDAPKVVLLGDSFIFGEAVDDAETLAQVLADRGFHIVNLAVTGHGPHQQLLALRRYVEGGGSADWVLTFAYTNDAEDVVATYQSMHHRPTASLRNARLHLDSFEPPVTEYLADYCYLFALSRAAFFNAPVRKDGDGPAIVAACLQEIELAAAATGATPLFFFHDALHPDDIRPLVQAAHSAGLSHVDLSPRLSEQIDAGQQIICADEIHWNRAGSEIVADAVQEQMKSSQFLTTQFEARDDPPPRNFFSDK